MTNKTWYYLITYLSTQFRGIVPRAIEDIFSRMDSKNKGDFHIILSMFQVRKDKMKDLITLNANELTRVGNFGPKV